MDIIVLFFVLFFVGCGANMNSFNIAVEGTVDYSNKLNNNNKTKDNANNNTNNGNTNNNTNNGNTNNNTNNGNTNNNTNNNNNVNITDNIGTQLGSKTALQVGEGTGIPTTGGESMDIQIYQNYLLFKYTETLTKIKYSNDIASIPTEGEVNGDRGRIPAGNKIIKVYFNKDGDSVSKIFEIQPATNPLP